MAQQHSQELSTLVRADTNGNLRKNRTPNSVGSEAMHRSASRDPNDVGSEVLRARQLSATDGAFVSPEG